MDRSPRYNRNKIIQKESDSIVQSIYNERKKSFLTSLDTILRQIGCANRRDIINQIDNTVLSNISSEREIFISKIAALITKDIDKNTKTFETMCSKLIDIYNRQFNQEKTVQQAISKIQSGQFTNITGTPIIDLLSYQLSQVKAIRGEINILKSSILSIISTFLSNLTSNRQQIKSQILRKFDESQMNKEQLKIQLKTQLKLSKEREQKIATMEQTIADLNDQVTFLKQQRASNARVTQLERQLAERNRQLEEQKRKSDEVISELEQELEEKTNFLEQQRK